MNIFVYLKKKNLGTSLAVQWLRQPPNAGGVVSIPGPEAEIPHALWPKKMKQKRYCNK